MVAPAAASGDVIRAEIRVNAAVSKGAWNPIWRFFGADEPNYAYMANGQKLLRELGALAPGQVYFRAHNLLTSGDGTPALKWGSTGVYREDEKGQPVYDWTILDRIFDTYLEKGVRPYAQIGFMPQDLSIKPVPYQHRWTPRARYEEIYTGWAYPPKDYGRWANLVAAWVDHCLQRYGRAEVDSWFWEVWNEPNIGYWRGSPAEFHKLHDYAIAAVRRVLPSARVGGPDVAGSGGRFMRSFLEHCLRGTNYVTGQIGTPLDFVSFHAKGAPVYTNDHVRMGISAHLRTIEEGFRILADYPELRGRPVVIGESDPEGCAACQGAPLAYRNGTMYSSYTAAVFARKQALAEKYGVNLLGALTWAFEFEGQPYFAGFRSLASNGIDKPVLNVFRLFSKMGGVQVDVESDRSIALDEIVAAGVRHAPDVSAVASLDANTLSILAWHYHDDDVPGPGARVRLAVSGLPAAIKRAVPRHFRIDQEQSNAFALWQRMGSPQPPTLAQLRDLAKAGQLAELAPGQPVSIDGGEWVVEFSLPRQAVSLLQLNW